MKMQRGEWSLGTISYTNTGARAVIAIAGLGPLVHAGVRGWAVLGSVSLAPPAAPGTHIGHSKDQNQKLTRVPFLGLCDEEAQQNLKAAQEKLAGAKPERKRKGKAALGCPTPLPTDLRAVSVCSIQVAGGDVKVLANTGEQEEEGC